jgi:hypothetical protein
VYLGPGELPELPPVTDPAADDTASG